MNFNVEEEVVAIGRNGATVAVLCLVQVVDVLGVTVVVAALPAMLADLNAPASAATPLATGYAMFFGGLLMLGSRLGDRYGHRRIVMVGLVAFGAASLMAATAASVSVLVAARCAQGAAAGLSVPAALRLVTAAAPDDDRRRRALAAWSASGAVAGVAGYLVGGLLTDVAGWQTVFWINLPLAAVLLGAVRVVVPKHPREPTVGLDLPGAALLTGAVMAVVLGASLLEQPGRASLGLATLAAAVVLLAGLVAVERRAATPLVPATALRQPSLRIGVGAALVNTATTSSVITLATLYLQQTRGLTPSTAALWLLPCSLGVVAGSALAAPVLRRRGPRAGIVVGLVTVAVGDALLLAMPAAEWLLPFAVAVSGIGLGMSSVGANTLGTAVPGALQGVASGALNTAAQLGTAVGVAGLLLLASVTDGSTLPMAGTPTGWLAASALAAVAAVVVTRAGRTSAQADPVARVDAGSSTNGIRET